MGDEKILDRSFSKQEQKKLACGVFIGCFIIAVNLWTVLQPYFELQPIYSDLESMKPIIRNLSISRSDVYDIEGDIRIHGNSSTIFIASSQNQDLSSWTTKPYAQKSLLIWKKITNFTIKMEAAYTIPSCNRNLSDIPAIVFAGRSNENNHFHAFSDVLFPLFLTSHEFNRTVLFLVTKKYPQWIYRYRVILEELSKFGVYDIDNENEVLCFSRMIVGLKAPPISLFIHPSESTNFPVGEFRKLLRSAFSLPRESVYFARPKTGKTIAHPRMLILSRGSSRQLLNEQEVLDMARSLGFDAVAQKMVSDVASVAQLVNSFDVLVGLHGAGLTNMVFLPEKAIVVQITPYGVDEEAKSCFEWPAESMKLRYLEYKVSVNESSLLGKYPPNSEVYKDPEAIKKKSYARFHTVYLDYQDVKLDLGRFRNTLLRTFELVDS